MIKKVFILVIILLFVGINTLTVVSSKKISDTYTSPTIENINNNLIVDDEGDGDFTTIQEAIDNAANGDFILVYSGNYSGIIINKTLNILGVDEEYLNGNDIGNPIIWGGEVYIVHTTDVVFSNFTLGAVTDIGKIKIENTNNSNISNCKANCLLLYGAHRNTIKNCEFATKLSSFATIDLKLSSNNTITDNICIAGATKKNYNVGLCLQQSHNNQLLNNNCIAKNTEYINGIDYAMYIVSSTGNIVNGNICWKSDIGIKLKGSNNNYISENNLTMNNYFALFLSLSNDNDIAQNNFINNTMHAFFYKSMYTTWNENYWDDVTYSSSKLIFGTIGPFFGLIPWVNFDWHPLKEPYDGNN